MTRNCLLLWNSGLNAAYFEISLSNKHLIDEICCGGQGGTTNGLILTEVKKRLINAFGFLFQGNFKGSVLNLWGEFQSQLSKVSWMIFGSSTCSVLRKRTIWWRTSAQEQTGHVVWSTWWWRKGRQQVRKWLKVWRKGTITLCSTLDLISSPAGVGVSCYYECTF